MMELAMLAAALAGYVLSIFTWPALRARLLGAEAEIAQLRARAADLEARLRAFGRRIGG